MGRTLAIRTISAAPLLFLVSILAFALVHLVPGGAAEVILGDGATPEAVAELNEQLGLDRPLLTQYFEWAGGAIRGDFGDSLIDGRDVWGTLTARLPITVSIAAAGLLVSVVLGIIAGVIAALNQGRFADRLVSLVSATGLAIPNFWVGILLAFWVGVKAGWLPALGYTPLTEDPSEWAKRLILPSLALGLGSAAVVARQTRSGLLDVLERPYIRTARSNSLSDSRILVVHAMKNAMVPVATVIGFQASVMLGGAFVIEQVFALPGLGERGVRAVLDQDIPMIQGLVMFAAVMITAVNILVDMSYAIFDPRVRVS